MNKIEEQAYITAKNWFYGTSNKAYRGNTDARHQAAIKLAESVGSSALSLPENSYRNRNFFIAHWGDKDDGFKEYYFLTLLTKSVEAAVKEPIVAFDKGTFKDIPTPGGYSCSKFSLKIGNLLTDEIVHGIAANTGHKGMKRQGVKPPYLAYGLMVVVSDLHAVAVDFFDGSCEVEKSKEPETKIPIYLGTFSLKDLQTYHATKAQIKRPYLTGNAASSVINAIDIATNQSLTTNHPSLIEFLGV